MPKFQCEYDPEKLIDEIGNSFFSICDDDYADGIYNHEPHPDVITIMDCESESTIDISSNFGVDETRRMAEALLKLLNQDYDHVKPEE
jgi:hypothetical protein